MKLLYVLIGLVLFLSCGKEDDLPIIPTEPAPDDNLVIWQIPLGLDSAEYSGMYTTIIDDEILYSTSSIEELEDETIRLVSATDGSPLWEWSEYINPVLGQSVSDFRLFDNTLIVCSAQDNYGINLRSGSTKWATLTEKGLPFISQYNEVIFHATQNGDPWPYGDSTRILYCHADLGDWREILKFRQEDFENYEISFQIPAAFTNEEGDTLLILKLDQITIAPFDSRLDLYCYNMTQDTMVWSHRQFDPYGGANILPPLIEGDYVYYVGVFEVHCLDKNTGVVQWKWGYPETGHSLQGSNFLLYQDKFIVKRGNGNLYALDKGTGAEQWVIEGVSNAGASVVEMRVYGDRLYYGSGEIFIIDLEKGQTLHKIKTPNRSARFPHAQFIDAVAVDEEHQRMYTTDGYFLMCMRLPE